MMNRRSLGRLALCAAAVASLGLPLAALAADEAPDAMIKRLSTDVLNTVKSDKAIQGGDLTKVIALVDKTVMPNVNFRRMFKILLVRTYAGALAQVNDQSIQVKPLRAAPEDKDVLVRTEIVGRGDPIQLDYRLEKTPGDGAGWKIYNLNVLGVWLVETYRGQFAQEINAKGIDGLIETLAARNKANSTAKG
jgi:phospholipid transport system substrate-binding protein